MLLVLKMKNKNKSTGIILPTLSKERIISPPATVLCL
jgi:hypothetical protein